MEFTLCELNRQREGMAIRFAEEIIRQRKKGGSYPEGLEGAEAEAYRQQVHREGELLWEEVNGSIEEVTEKIMEAFDRAHPRGKDVRLQPLAPRTTIEYMGH